MTAARGWSMWEEIGIMPPNVLRCIFCDTAFGYLGVAPSLCNKCGKPMSEPQIEEAPPEMTFDDFRKADIRFGTIKSANTVPKSEKLLQMHVGFGGFDRTILAGIGKTFKPEDLIGKTALFVVNLAPRKLMGIESHGMMLATGAPESLTLAFPSGDVPAGSRLG